MLLEVSDGRLCFNDPADRILLSDFEEMVGGRLAAFPLPSAVPGRRVLGYVAADPRGLPLNCHVPGVGDVRGVLLIVGVEADGRYRDLESDEFRAYRLDRSEGGVPVLAVDAP